MRLSRTASGSPNSADEIHLVNLLLILVYFNLYRKYVCTAEIYIGPVALPGSVVYQSVARLIKEPEVPGSIPGPATYVCGNLKLSLFYGHFSLPKRAISYSQKYGRLVLRRSKPAQK